MLGQWEECKMLSTEPGSLVLVWALGPPSLPSVCSLSCLPWHLSLHRSSIEALISQAHLPCRYTYTCTLMLYRILNPDLPKPTLGLLLPLLTPSILEGLPRKHLKGFLLFGVLEDNCNLPPSLHEITGAPLRLPFFILACSWSQAPSCSVFPPLSSRFPAF